MGDDLLHEIATDVRGLVGAVGEVRAAVAVLDSRMGAVEKMEPRIRALEIWRWKAVGAATAVAAIVGGLSGVLAKALLGTP